MLRSGPALGQIRLLSEHKLKFIGKTYKLGNISCEQFSEHGTVF